VTPKLDVTVDKPTISTELYSTNMVTVSLQGSGGLTGSVALTASVVDGSGVALPRWTVALDKPSVDLAADGTATVVASVKVPSDSAALQGTVKVEATSAAGSISSGASAAVNVTKQLTVNLTVDANGDCVYPAAMVGTVKVANGTKIRWVNGSTGNLTVHITDPKIDGLTHQQGATPPAGVYERTVAGATGTTDWYCHDLNNPKNMLLQAVP
jgi:plastocyanin